MARNDSLSWKTTELAKLRRLNSPDRVQVFLDKLPYRCESVYVPPLLSIREHQAHCMDGALLAACALLRAGYDAKLLDLCAEDDDDHVLCVYRMNGSWGAVAKSNFPGLRFREPIFRNIRELVLSYFESYFNLDGKKSLRRYSAPVALPALTTLNWECSHTAAESVVERLERARHYSLLSRATERSLRRVDARFFESQMVGVDFKGAYGGDSYRENK